LNQTYTSVCTSGTANKTIKLYQRKPQSTRSRTVTQPAGSHQCRDFEYTATRGPAVRSLVAEHSCTGQERGGSGPRGGAERGVVLVVGSSGRRLTLKEREWGASASASPSASEKPRRKGNAEPCSTRLCACASTAATSSVARRSASYLASISLRDPPSPVSAGRCSRSRSLPQGST